MSPLQTIAVEPGRDASRSGLGADGGIFGGYGYTLGAVYLGVEAEAELGNGDWGVKRDPTGRIYSVAKTYSFGGAVRAGYMFGHGSLIYGRVGAVSAEFHNRYERGMRFVEPDIACSGIRWGGGMETPIADALRLRFDYTWTSYRAYEVDYATGIDAFRNSENLFRVGIVRSF